MLQAMWMAAAGAEPLLDSDTEEFLKHEPTTWREKLHEGIMGPILMLLIGILVFFIIITLLLVVLMIMTSVTSLFGGKAAKAKKKA